MIESDEDFVNKKLNELDIDELDKIPDKRVSGFWKMSWLEFFLRFMLFIVVVWVNEQGYVNPHHEKFIWADWKIGKISYDPFPPNKEEDYQKHFTFWGLLPYDNVLYKEPE